MRELGKTSVWDTLLWSSNTATIPAAASAAANVEAFATGKCCRHKVDLSQASQARITAMVIAAGNAVGASLKLSFSNAEAATWSGADAGPIVILGTNGGAAGILHDSGWINLAAGARIDNCFLTLLVGTAFGNTAPTLGSLTVRYR